MAEMEGKAQLPVGETTSPQAGGEAAVFEQGLELGRIYAERTVRRIAAWAEEHPGQLLLAGVMAGFVLGKLLFHRKRPQLEDLD